MAIISLLERGSLSDWKEFAQALQNGEDLAMRICRLMGAV